MKSRGLAYIPSPLVAVAVGVLCVAYVQLSDSASLPTSESKGSIVIVNNKPTRITTLKTSRPARGRLESQAGRMKAADIKACISKAFCEVNSASRTPNYAVNKEFFDIMNEIQALSDEDLDSGSASTEYEDDDEEEEDVESSEESSMERGYPAGPPPHGASYRMGRNLKEDGNSTTTPSSGNSTTPATTKKPKSKVKGSKRPSTKSSKKKMKVKTKTFKKYVNGTFISVPKRRGSRVETEEEKAERQAYLTRKQREMGQVNDLAALIRISADIGLTLRSPRKCRTLFNKCSMTHEQIVDLFNQTLMAVTTPASVEVSSSSVASTTAGKTKVSTTSAVPTTSPTTSKQQESLKTTLDSLATVAVSSATQATTSGSTTSTITPVTTTVDDGNRSSKSRHDFSDEDVEYLTDTEIQPVHTYALFVNDPPEDSVKTMEDITHVQETFKKYANTFPAETNFGVELPALKKSKKHGKKHAKQQPIAKRRKASSEEDDEEDEDEEDDAASVSVEGTNSNKKSGFRIESPYPGYRVNKQGSNKVVDEEMESQEPSSAFKESNEGILPPLVEKQKVSSKVKVPTEEEEEAEEDEDEESEEEDEEEARAKGTHVAKSKKKGGDNGPVHLAGVEEEEESSEEDEAADEVEPQHQHDEHKAPPPNVYQMYMQSQKQKGGYKKKQKGPYKGGEGIYYDNPIHGGAPPSGGNNPWGGAPAHEPIPASSHESAYGDSPYGHHPPPYGAGPHGSSQEVGAEQKPGFFQSIMSWFTGNKNADQNAQQQPESSPYGAPAPAPYGQQASQSGGSPWPQQPDPAGVGHFGQSYNPHGHHHHHGHEDNSQEGQRYRHRDASSEEEEEDDVEVEEFLPRKKDKSKGRRRYRGRSDSIITSQPKKSSSTAKKSSGPPPPVVIVPKKETKVQGKHGSSSVAGVYEPNNNFETLLKANEGLLSSGGSNVGGKKKDKENKRFKKETKKSGQNKKKSQKQTQRAHPGSNESDDDDEAYSSEELYNKQLSKLKSGNIATIGGSSSNSNTGSNSGNNKNGNKAQNSNDNNNGVTETSFPSYFESMFGSEDKNAKLKMGNDDGSLLFGFDSLSSQLGASATPPELPATGAKKSSYKVNKNKKKKTTTAATAAPIKFKDVPDSSEEDEEKKKKK